jgi:predicted amidohydrolase YtcJ
MRSCLVTLGLAMGTLSCSSSGPRGNPIPPAADVLFVNARFHTLDLARPLVTALAVRDGRIVELGDRASLEPLVGPDTRTIDLGGGVAVPGLVDTHGHLLGLGLGLVRLDLVGAATLAEALERVRGAAARLGPGEWLLGRGWDQNDWPEKVFPTRLDLDRGSADRPVFLTRVDGHAAWVNSAALSAAGVTAETPDPPGGRLLRGPDGAPSGILVDRAMELVSRKVPPPSREAKKEALKRAVAEAVRFGLTGVHDAGVDDDVLELYCELADDGALPLRVYAMIYGTAPGLDDWLKRGPRIDPDGRLTVRAIKLVADGALGSRGAALLEPYSDDPSNSGLPNLSTSAIRSFAERALAAGFQVCTHAIGDRANRDTLDAYEEALKPRTGVDHRFRIEHAQVLAPDDVTRFARLGVIASMQATHCTSDMPWAPARLGPERIRGAYAWRSLLKSGARLSGGSDFPVERVNPLLGLYASMTRQDPEGRPEGGFQPEQRMTAFEALQSYTTWAAYAGFEEKHGGRLQVGLRADLTVLSVDPLACAPQELLRAETRFTIVGGRVVWRRGAGAPPSR